MELKTKTLLSLPTFPLTFFAIVFLPAWSLDFWQGWVYCIVFSVTCCLMLLYLLEKNPKLLERRFRTKEPRKAQFVLVIAIRLAFIAVLVVAGFDHRFGWSQVPTVLAIAAQVLLMAGLLIVFQVLRENSYASTVVMVEEGQKVVSTGLYRVVRHPMYMGALLMQLATPVAMGSWWAMLAIVPFVPIALWRLLDEEKCLSAGLPGYKEYMERTRYHLIPGIW